MQFGKSITLCLDILVNFIFIDIVPLLKHQKANENKELFPVIALTVCRGIASVTETHLQQRKALYESKKFSPNN